MSIFFSCIEEEYPEISLERLKSDKTVDLCRNILISYVYYCSYVANYNLSYFIENEVKKNIVRKNNQKNEESVKVFYVFVINGFELKVEIPANDNILVIYRSNIGFDFGGHYCALKTIHKIHKLDTFSHFIFMNDGVIGPILPPYLDKSFLWYNCFINKLNDSCKLVSTSIVCLPETDLGGYGPKCESFFFVTDFLGLSLFLAEKTIFDYHFNKKCAVLNGEYSLSKCIFKNNYTIDCMINLYQNIDWRNIKNHNLNYNLHPSRYQSLYGISINPLEVIFHKWYWSEEKNFINKEYIDYYKIKIDDLTN